MNNEPENSQVALASGTEAGEHTVGCAGAMFVDNTDASRMPEACFSCWSYLTA